MPPGERGQHSLKTGNVGKTHIPIPEPPVPKPGMSNLCLALFEILLIHYYSHKSWAGTQKNHHWLILQSSRVKLWLWRGSNLKAKNSNTSVVNTSVLTCIGSSVFKKRVHLQKV